MQSSTLAFCHCDTRILWRLGPNDGCLANWRPCCRLCLSLEYVLSSAISQCFRCTNIPKWWTSCSGRSLLKEVETGLTRGRRFVWQQRGVDSLQRLKMNQNSMHSECLELYLRGIPHLQSLTSIDLGKCIQHRNHHHRLLAPSNPALAAGQDSLAMLICLGISDDFENPIIFVSYSVFMLRLQKLLWLFAFSPRCVEKLSHFWLSCLVSTLCYFFSCWQTQTFDNNWNGQG